MRNINFYIQANLRDLEHIYYSSRAPPCTTFGASHSLAHSLSLKTHYLRCLPVLPLLLYLLLLSLPAASAAACVQACCWFLTAQQIRFARQCSSVLTWMHLSPASIAKSRKEALLASWVLPPTSSLPTTRQPTKRVPCAKGGVVKRLRA
jgi:hypothetical protein